MKTYKLAYGNEYITFQLPEAIHQDLLAPNYSAGNPDPNREVIRALRHPLGNINLANLHGVKSVAIAINDKTRPVPNDILLPPLLAELHKSGLSPEAISLVIASGTHIPMVSSEYPLILPKEIIEKYPVYSHNCDDLDLVELGVTSRGTPVLANKIFMEADLRIVTGNIEPHHFMGFSGGVKSAAVGLAGRKTINQNHALLPHPSSKSGHYFDNPMRIEVEEIGKRMTVHYALNAILNNDKEIIKVLAGDPIQVMETGIPLVRSLCQVSVDGVYDLVIASAGGYPKDINLYQSQKALTHASMITRDGGTVILLAACAEKIGSEGYRKFMDGLTSFTEVFNKFNQHGFEVGPHKAFLVARDASRVNIKLLSTIDPSTVNKLLLTPINDFNATLDQAIKNNSDSMRIAILPIATITIPEIQN
jgi:lactate racemase